MALCPKFIPKFFAEFLVLIWMAADAFQHSNMMGMFIFTFFKNSIINFHFDFKCLSDFLNLITAED